MYYLDDRQDYRLSIDIKNLKLPNNIKAVYLTKELYDENGKATTLSSYEFFIEKDKLQHLARILLQDEQ